jgi:parvulin-like peptidyl-prolyl isomerase
MEARMNTRLLRILICLLLGAVPLGAAELVEKIVVRVNDQLITYSEFQKRLEGGRPPQESSDPAKIRVDTLNEMIREKLLAERAKEMQVSATDAEVEEAVERVKRQYNLATDAEFDAALAQSKMTREDLKKQMRETITLQKVVGRDVTSKLDISDDMLRLEYERQKEKLYRIPEQARVFEIVVRFSPDDPGAREKAAARIEEARAKLAAGASFADLAKQYSEGNARDRGGDLGTVSHGELLPALDAAVFSSPPQEYPAPVLLPGSIHLYRVTDRKPAGFKRFEEVSEDVRKRINENLYETKFNEYIDKLRREAFVKIYDPELAKAEAAEKKS